MTRTEQLQELRKKLNLRYRPTEFSSRNAAFGWSNTTVKPSVVMLGENQKFWVVCFSDASRLERAGYERAK